VRVANSKTMSDALLNVRESAQRLGIAPSQLYAWLRQSDRGEFVLRGQHVTIEYFQGGPRGQGRIRIHPREIDRLNGLMQVSPREMQRRRPPLRRDMFPGISVPLGRPK
jgi:transposase-like protein